MPVVRQRIDADVSDDQPCWQFIRHSRVLVSVCTEHQRHTAVVADVLPHRAVQTVRHLVAGYPLRRVVAALAYDTGGT